MFGPNCFRALSVERHFLQTMPHYHLLSFDSHLDCRPVSRRLMSLDCLGHLILVEKHRRSTALNQHHQKAMHRPDLKDQMKYCRLLERTDHWKGRYESAHLSRIM